MAKHMKQPQFEYVQTGTIDEELLCSICSGPFHQPVCAEQCGHTFCRQCIDRWVKKSGKCPTCRCRVSEDSYLPVKTRVVLNQLSRLHVKCLLCNQTNIENREKHEIICPNAIVPCSAADLQCFWTGKRDELESHLKTCSFTPLRPILEPLQKQLETIRKIQMKQQSFIQALFNDGDMLSRNCTDSSCFMHNSSHSTEESTMPCSMCKKQVASYDIHVHSCRTHACICDPCFEKQTEELPPTTLKRKLSEVDHNDAQSSSSSDSEIEDEEEEEEEEDDDDDGFCRDSF